MGSCGPKQGRSRRVTAAASTTTGSCTHAGHMWVFMNDCLFLSKGRSTHNGRVRTHEPGKEIQIIDQEPQNAEADYALGAK